MRSLGIGFSVVLSPGIGFWPGVVSVSGAVRAQLAGWAGSRPCGGSDGRGAGGGVPGFWPGVVAVCETVRDQVAGWAGSRPGGGAGGRGAGGGVPGFWPGVVAVCETVRDQVAGWAGSRSGGGAGGRGAGGGVPGFWPGVVSVCGTVAAELAGWAGSRPGGGAGGRGAGGGGARVLAGSGLGLRDGCRRAGWLGRIPPRRGNGGRGRLGGLRWLVWGSGSGVRGGSGPAGGLSPIQPGWGCAGWGRPGASVVAGRSPVVMRSPVVVRTSGIGCWAGIVSVPGTDPAQFVVPGAPSMARTCPAGGTVSGVVTKPDAIRVRRRAWRSGGSAAAAAGVECPGRSSATDARPAGPDALPAADPDDDRDRAPSARRRMAASGAGGVASSDALSPAAIAPGLVPGPAAVVPRRVATIGRPRRATAALRRAGPDRAGTSRGTRASIARRSSPPNSAASDRTDSPLTSSSPSPHGQ